MLNHALFKISVITAIIIPFSRNGFSRKLCKYLCWGGENSNLLTSNNIVVNDSNFNSYFDDDGYIINEEIKENSTLYFGNISNRNVIINIPLNMQPYTPNSQIINSTFRITDDGSGSAIRNFVFNSTLTSRNPDYYAPIIIDEASDVVVENNIIYMEYFDGCNYNLAALSIYGESLNNFVSGNRITIISNSKSRDEHYIYGIQITGSSINGGVFARNSPSGNIVKYNTITIDSDYYASGIYTSFIKHTIIDNNELNLKAKNFTYGIVCDYFSASSDMLQSTNISISHNNVKCNSSMAYLIQIFNVDDVIIYNNTVYGDANAAYGISGYSCNNHEVFNNQIIVNGNDISMVGINVDAIATGHNGIYYMMDSSSLTIHDNNVLSNYTSGGDYAIRFDSSSTYNINVCDNNLSSNHLEYNGDNAVFGEVNVYNNNPYYFDDGVVNYTTYVTYEIYVDINGDDVGGNASSDNPFATLNRAISYLKILTLQNTNKSVGIKGIIHMGNGSYVGFGSNLRMTISGLNVDIIGSANTTIDGGNSNWFFEISDDSIVSLQNINFIKGLYRGKDSGVILNNGFLTLKNCNISNCRVNDASSIIYNTGILKLSKNNLTENKVKTLIYNKGKIDNLIIDFMGNSSNNVLNVNSSYVPLIAYVHDDMGNPVSGGYVKFYIQGKEVYTTGDVINGIAKSKALIALTGSLKVSGFYSNSYSNTFINYGIINSTIIVDGIIFYVSVNGSDVDGDGSKENPFKTINKVFTLGSPTSQMIIYLSEGNFKQQLSEFNSAYTIKINGVENKTVISSDWNIKDAPLIKLENLIFNKVSVNVTNTNLEVNNCYFTNAATTSITSVGGTLLVVDSTFKDNCVKSVHKNTEWGGAIYKAYGNLTVIRCLFDGNEAAHGGAIYSNQSDLYVSKSKFVNNLAFCGYSTYTYSSGGAILQYLGRDVVISDTSFEDNSANSFGGAFYSLGVYPCVRPDLMLEPGYFIDGADFLRNPIYKGFVGDMDSPQDIYFINCNFTNNLAPLGGGAVFIANNSFTEYIGCRFDSNLAYTYDVSVLFNTLKTNWVTYDYYQDGIESLYLVENNYGGAIFDKNLHVADTYFEANTFSSGGSLVLPSVLSSEAELNFISKHNVGISKKTVSDGEEVYVSDSSILTGEDSRFLGISGWIGTYDGPSINKQIKDYTRPENANGNGNGNGNGEGGSESGGNGEGSGSGSGNGNGNGEGSGTGEGSGSGSGSSQGNALTMGDILNYLSANGANLVSNNGNGISVADIMNLINSHNENTVPVSNASSAENDKDIVNNNPSSNVNPVNVSSADVVEVNSSSNTSPNNDSSSDVETNSSNVNPNNATSSENLIEVNSTSDMTPEESGGHVSNDQVAVDVGESSNPLTGVDSDDNADSSETPSAQDSSSGGASYDSNGGGSSDSSSAPSSPSDAGSSSGAHEISKKIDDEGKLLEKDNVWYSFLIVIILCILLIIGYKSRRDEEE